MTQVHCMPGWGSNYEAIQYPLDKEDLAQSMSRKAAAEIVKESNDPYICMKHIGKNRYIIVRVPEGTKFIQA